MARGFALCFGLLFALATLAACGRPALDLAVWIVDIRPLPAVPVLAASACLMGAFALCPATAGPRRAATAGVAALLGVLALRDAGRFYAAWHAGHVRPFVPVPLSLGVAIALAAIAAAAIAPRATRPARVAVTAAACALAFPVAQMLCFGASDYRRRADAALVFGARAYADGRASDALEDRVLAACALYHQGLVGELILSGGAGDGATSEPEAMRRVALAAGVPDERILLDTAGISTEASVDDARAIAARQGLRRIIAVSHAYHLPRIKLELQRAHLAAVTVPAAERHWLAATPWFIAREVAAWWLHVLDLAT